MKTTFDEALQVAALLMTDLFGAEMPNHVSVQVDSYSKIRPTRIQIHVHEAWDHSNQMEIEAVKVTVEDVWQMTWSHKDKDDAGAIWHSDGVLVRRDREWRVSVRLFWTHGSGREAFTK